MPSNPAQEYEPDLILDGRYRIVRIIGHGAFSKVVLASSLKGKEPMRNHDMREEDTALANRYATHKRSQSGGYSGIGLGHARNRSLGKAGVSASASKLHQSMALDDSSEDETSPQQSTDYVAIKMISRSHIQKNDRMRISIVREVEVLKVRSLLITLTVNVIDFL